MIAHEHTCPTCRTRYTCQIRHRVDSSGFAPRRGQTLVRLCPFAGHHRRKVRERDIL
jgi:hypothetical protein